MCVCGLKDSQTRRFTDKQDKDRCMHSSQRVRQTDRQTQAEIETGRRLKKMGGGGGGRGRAKNI